MGQGKGPRTLQAMAVLMIAVVSSITACRGRVSDDVGRVDQNKQASNAMPTEPDITFDVLLPTGVGLNDVAVGASEDLELGPHSRILGLQQAPGRIAVAGVDPGRDTAIGPGSVVGDIASVPPVVLGPKQAPGTFVRQERSR